MTPDSQRKIFVFSIVSIGFAVGTFSGWSGLLGLWSHLDEALMDIEEKDHYSDNEIKFSLDPATNANDWSLGSGSKKIRVYMDTRDEENPIHGTNAEQVLEKLKKWNGGQNFMWECTMYFNKPSDADDSLEISDEDKRVLERFFQQIQQTVNNPEARPSARGNKWRMISECAHTRPEENKRIRKEKKLDSETLSAVLVFNLKEEKGKLVFANRELFENVFCHIYYVDKYRGRFSSSERKAIC